MNDSVKTISLIGKERSTLSEPKPQEEEADNSFPMSFSQEGLWFLHQLEPASSAYNISRMLWLKGELEIDALRQSLNQVVERHEALRTSFGIRDGAPCQQISAAATLRLEVEDLSGLGESAARAAAEARARVEAERPFDLSAGPLLRARLLRVGAREQVLLLCLHHIICDGWSMEILFAELERFYNRARLGVVEAEPELEIQYADYALWQRERLQGAELAEQLDYWREQLSGALGVLELPTDRVRPAVQSYRGGVERWSLSGGLRAGLQQLGQREGATLFMVLLAAFQTLLWRYTGQGQVVVGTPVANRPQVAVEGLIGFFVNTLALRSRVAGEESFVGLLGQVKETCVGAYGHQELPFEKLVEELQPERSLAHSPLFQVMLTMQGTPRKQLDLYQLETSIEEVHNAASKCDLSLYVTQDSGSNELKLWLEYNAELFAAPTVKGMLQHYQNLLEGIVLNPKQRLAELPLLTESEKHSLLAGMVNKTDYPRGSCIHQLFEAEVERRPQQIALSSGDEQLTYWELNRRANQLAHYLRAQGVGLEDRIAVVLDRSPNLMVGLLAVLKAGGAYVPLDPHYPAERLSAIIADAGIKLALTETAFRDSLANSSVDVICLDQAPEQSGRHEEHNPETRAEAINLAYLIYTSGSAGQPKGVAVPHRSVVRLVKHTDYVEFGPEQVLLLLSAVTFDASTFEIWGSLLNGSTLAIMPPGPFSLEELGEALQHHGVTTLWLTAGLFHLMVGRRLDDLMSLRQLLAGGDVLSPAHSEAFLSRAVHARLINGYGPTENTTFTCCHSMSGPQSFESSVPIGRPINNTSVLILDPQMRLVPRGVWGELYTGGDGLARCYFNRPALTAASFVPDPFSAERGARLYRTGDLARHLPDGSIEFGGRLDQQVKVRGFRVEPQEIESALGQHERVAECIVIAREDVPGDQRLVAYLVARGSQVELGDLRNYLSEKLPQYMVPGNFVWLERLPLTANGKVDRRALPAPDIDRKENGSFIAPRGQTEQELADIWSQLLRVDGIGVQDNFFDLGGHSLLATQLLSRIRSTFTVDLKLHDIFVSPTIAEIAELIDSALIIKGADSEIDEALDMLDRLADDEARKLLDERII